MGSIFGGGSDVQAPNYQAQIEELRAAGERAAGMGVFKPVTISTSFGTPKYTYDEQGRLVSAGYTAAPWLQDLQAGGQGLSGQYQNVATQQLADTRALQNAALGYGAGQQLYGAAQQALPTSYDITQNTQDYYNRMQQMVAPQRERQLASTRQNLFNRGRQGLSIGATQAGGQLATNPEMAAYYNAVAQQDLGLANQAEQQALSNLAQRQGMALSLFGTGASQLGTGANLTNDYLRNITAAQVPFAASLANLNTLEGMAMSPVELGIRLGTPTTQGMQYGGSQIMNAAQNAAELGAKQEQARVAAANANSAPGFWDSLAMNTISSLARAGTNYLTGNLFSSSSGEGLFSSWGRGPDYSDAGMTSAGFKKNPDGTFSFSH